MVIIMRLDMETRNSNLIKMMEDNPSIIDNHTGREEKLAGLVEFNNPENGLGCCFNAAYFSVNACIMSSDGKLHCSQCSIGGVLWGITSEDIDEYNDTCLYEGGKIKCIHLPNGDKVYPAA